MKTIRIFLRILLFILTVVAVIMESEGKNTFSFSVKKGTENGTEKEIKEE